MRTQAQLHQAIPTREEIEAVMRRAHKERAQAFRNLFRALFGSPKAGAAKPVQAAHADALACR